jgi:DNA-binding transcriptional MerR regulator
LTLECAPRFIVGRMSATAVTAKRLRVVDLAHAVGVASDTIRYYEKAGLLPAPQRTSAGYRAYDTAAIDRVEFIQGAQRLGLRLRDIRDLLAIRDTGVCPCEPAEQLLRRRLVELDAEMARLVALRAQMVQMIDALPAADCPPPVPGTWCPPDGNGGDLHA